MLGADVCTHMKTIYEPQQGISEDIQVQDSANSVNSLYQEMQFFVFFLRSEVGSVGMSLIVSVPCCISPFLF